MSQKQLDEITDKVFAYSDQPKQVLETIAGAPDRPLKFGDVHIPCYVLEDETRVVTQRGFFSGINATRGGPRHAKETGAEMPRFATQNWLKPFISNELGLALKFPILFKLPTGQTAYGYPATVLREICDAIIEAERQGSTTDRQKPMVDRAWLLFRGLADVGIISLVDEATGYQRIRAENALAKILEKFIAKELRGWTKTFPIEFYEQICRLKGWPPIYSIKRPSLIGRYTNDLVYERIAPGVLDELKRINPVVPETGRRQHKHHQWFTPDVGHPKLQQHLGGLLALMRISPSWESFKRKLKNAFPKFGDTGHLDLDTE